MTEADYIAATNLAKVRIALMVVRDIFFTADAAEAEQATIVAQLVSWRLALEREVQAATDA